MATWLQYLIAFATLLVCAPVVAWAAKSWGSRAKGGLMLASVLLGFGAVMDQPAKHAIEATDEEKGSRENDDPLP